MLINGYSLYDRKVLQFHPPFFSVSDGAATRTLSDVLADPNTLPARHPNDFVLYRVCQFNDSSGELLPTSPAIHIAECQSLAPIIEQRHPQFADHAVKPQMNPNGTFRDEEK